MADNGNTERHRDTGATTEQRLFKQYARDSVKLQQDRAVAQGDIDDAARHLAAGHKGDLTNTELAATVLSPGVAIATKNPAFLMAPVVAMRQLDQGQHQNTIAGNYQDRALADLKVTQADRLALTADQQQIVDYVKSHAAPTLADDGHSTSNATLPNKPQPTGRHR